jgi:hypothetical protein
MKRLESMLQRLKVRLLRLDVMLHPLSGLLLEPVRKFVWRVKPEDRKT